MSFDFSTLITDRTQADVTKKSAKGVYNASDLNRVTACMEYLNEELRKLGYESGYKPVVVHQQEEPESRLPEGYTELEWIEGTGSQYIDTGIRVQNPVQTESEYQLTMQVTSTGVLQYTGANYCLIMGVSPNGYYQIIDETPIKVGGKNTVSIKAYQSGLSEIYIDGVKQGSFTLAERQTNIILGIFRLGNPGGAWFSEANTLKAKVWECKYLENSVLMYHAIPCSNQYGDVGMYDIIGGKFFKNSGSGSFTPGPNAPIPEPPEPEFDTYTWYVQDAPTVSQMAQYLANVSAIRSVFTLPDDAPQTPESMALLTFVKANDIESVLQYVENTIQQTIKCMARSNSFTFWSGNRPFPTAESNKGRNWAELDAMETGWRNWQVATWYLLLYGNLKAEGDVV